MEKFPIPQVDLVARRELSLTGSSEKVIVELGRPRQIAANEAMCSYRFTYNGHTVGMDIHGVDTFQALELALNLLPTELRFRRDLPVGKMYWLERGDDLGFPEKDQHDA